MDPEPASILLSNTLIATQLALPILILLVLLLCSALVSGAEVAFFSLTKLEISNKNEKKVNVKELVVSLLQHPKKLLATILIANNAINIAIVLLFDLIGQQVFKNIASTQLRFALEVVLVTFLILLFGEILPKVYANRNRIQFANFMSRPIKVLDTLFSPLSIPMSKSTLFLQERLGRQKTNLSVDQLSQALELTSDDETTVDEQKILQGIVSFGNTDTKQVMQPRIDVFGIEIEATYQEIIQEIIKKGFSRVPVYEENIDHVIGILYIKDLLPHIDKTDYEWKSLIRQPYFVPENKKLDDLLREFQEKKIHLAIVVDEYGGTSGLISLEDIIEEIVGDISDEFDDEDVIYSKLNENNFVFEGKTSLKDFYRVINIVDDTLFENQKGESETIAGFILEISKGFPKRYEKINFDNYTFTIEALDRKRLKQIKVTIN